MKTFSKMYISISIAYLSIACIGTMYHAPDLINKVRIKERLSSEHVGRTGLMK